jgi:hypothetical protein
MRRIAISLVVLGAAVLLPQSVFAHIERNSYWPDAGVDKAVKGGTGGKVPKARSLTSAAKSRRGSRVRVVCKPSSLKSAYTSIRRARRTGVRIRPTVASKKISAKKARGLKRLNKKFFKRCKYRNIQRAVFRSRNNDRIVVMPGLYTEAPSRAKPTNDPRCSQYRVKSDKGANAASYEYQVHCPNDQSLIFVGGRALSSVKPPDPPRANRHGIPDAGPCKRCNLQIEGSGASPDDVRVDGAKDPRRSQLRKQGQPVKDVVLKADRADGFVIRNMTIAHAHEHGLYVHEADGYLIKTMKLMYSGEYGTLTFASDHGLTADCEAAGHGDSGVYPGGAVDTGEQGLPGTAPRLNQAITRCDVHHNTLGYSGTMGNATHVYGNNFYDNGTGITTDSFFAGGHPGYPQDSAVFENNNIYSNNFNSYAKGSDVIPRVPIPVGTGILIGGGNNNEIRGNRIWDNWRRGGMLMAVPDAVSGNVGNGSTSNRNRFHDNVMGTANGSGKGPNGVDFWWDQYPGNTDNCWYSNGNVTTDPVAPFMPSDCKNTSSGAFYPSRGGELGGCAAALETGDQIRSGSGSNPQYDEKQCTWFTTPPKPGSGSSSPPSPLPKKSVADFARVVRDMCDLSGSTTLSCDAFRGRP